MKKILILGSAALKIGEAGEFDYSGSQAIKALKEEGLHTILINPNIATIQTSDNLAERVYFLPVNPHFVERVIERERPDAVLLSFGGQTALNCGVELYKKGIFDKFNVKVLGTPVETIIETEDRGLFKQKLEDIDVNTPKSSTAETKEDALAVASQIGYPLMVRIAYALGGLGSGVCRNEHEFLLKIEEAFSCASQILIEEYLEGWKEIEYEVVRDAFDNCITVCNMENFDPLGIHTGESIVVAPSQTLTDEEYHKLREISIRVVRSLKIVGECNVQFALDTKSSDYRVIEVNARLSRSSALASKATGYPLAFVAAKLALGKSLVDIKNMVTGSTSACFEPALDYIVVKMPRWDLQKFRMISKKIGSSMKSVGEVMAIGRNFEEAFQKAIRMLAIGAHGLIGDDAFQIDDIEEELKNPTDERIFAIALAFKHGMDLEKIYQLTHVNRWYLTKMRDIVDMYRLIEEKGESGMTPQLMLQAKQMGFSDTQISLALGLHKNQVRDLRKSYNITPTVKQIDTLAAEHPARTNYLYTTYNGTENDVEFGAPNSVIVLGSGAYKIGSSVEFDWCCMNAVQTLKKLNLKTIMINYNPETVSTDYDECDRLYFDELSFETVMDIYEKENPLGILLSMGGQISNNLALKLHNAGVRILGTSPKSIDTAEDRHKFSQLLDTLDIDQPLWKELKGVADAKIFAREIGYPVLVRPSYVLSGAAFALALNDDELERFLKRAAAVSSEYPVVISKFLMNAKELDIDAVAKDGVVIASVISEHVENAGVHSGDATVVVPPQRTYLETTRRINKITSAIAKALDITGPFNIQFLAKGNEVKVIECNLRASRSFPFVSKVTGANLIDIATRVMMGYGYDETKLKPLWDLDYVGVKAPQFSFTRLKGADPTLSVEMSSTGEVACLGDDFEEAFLKSMISVGYRVPIKKIFLSTGPLESKVDFLESARSLIKLGVEIYATDGTSKFLTEHGVKSEKLHWPLEDINPNSAEYIKRGEFDLVINIPKNYQKEELTNGYLIRRAAADHQVPLLTNLQVAKRFVEALQKVKLEDLSIKAWDEYLNT
ncbi:MAG: carbamoyl-phosphate synthase (glutamine-hydrolyzing) large subunit [Pseudomonadota bacterium]